MFRNVARLALLTLILAGAIKPATAPAQQTSPVPEETQVPFKNKEYCKQILKNILPTKNQGEWSERSSWLRFREDVTFTSEEELLRYIDKTKNAYCDSPDNNPKHLRSLCFLTQHESAVVNGALEERQRIDTAGTQRCRATSAKDWIGFPGDGRARYEAFLKVVEENAARKKEADAVSARIKQAENTNLDLEFKGFRIGDPLQPLLRDKRYRCEQFTSELARCGLVYKHICEFQSFPAYLTDYYRSKGLPFTGVSSCQDVVDKDNSNWATVAGVPIEPTKVYLYFLDGKLISLVTGFPAGAASTVYEAAKQKYGTPPDPAYMYWPAKGKSLSFSNDGVLRLKDEDSSKLWEQKYAAKQKADSDAEVLKAQRQSTADIKRRAKDF